MAKHLHVKKGDTVVVLTGTDKGNKGKVIYTVPTKNKVVVEQINMIKRHQKPNVKHPTGGIIDKEAPMNASNVKLICPKCSEKTRATRHVLDDGKVMRRCPKCSEVFK